MPHIPWCHKIRSDHHIRGTLHIKEAIIGKVKSRENDSTYRSSYSLMFTGKFLVRLPISPYILTIYVPELESCLDNTF